MTNTLGMKNQQFGYETTKYEPIKRYYVVGSNATETSFRVVKLDRTESRDLVLHDDKVEYTKRQIRNMLTMIKSGNTTKENKDSELGLIKTVSAFGIIGFVKFLEGYYVILITKRRKVALIGPHIIYKVEDTSMLYIPNDSVRYSHPEEARYVKLFQSIDLSSNFYFSYSYDLTHSLQYNMISVVPQQKVWNLSQEGQHQSRAESESEGQKQHDHTSNNKGTVYSVKWKSEDKYVWNSYLLKCCRHLLHTDWILCLTHGFVDQKNICVYGKPLYLTLIARRSNRFAGTRFLKRGANSEGYVANEVETEQIVIDNSVTFLDRANVTSFVQTRGSIPLYWSQDVAKMVPKPPIMLDQRDTFAGAAGLHFNQLLKRHGAPVIILNLVKRHERRRHESILTEEFKATISYLNQFLPNEHKIQYIGFDMAQVSKSKKKSVLGRLEEIAKFCVKQSGFYINMQKQVRDNFWEVDECKGIKGHKTAYGCQQTGVVRTNCVDCLDRTNTAQFALGKCALGYQMFVLGVIPSPDLEYDTDCLKMLEQLYEAQGDTIALQYGGSQLVHRIEGYRKIAPWTSHSKDIMHTLSRYYSNTFSDLEKQHATNIFLGLFTPAEGKLNMWELPTDFYLHNRDVPGIMGYLCRSYCQWWDVPVYKSLPLPYDEVRKSEDSQVDVTTEDDERVNHYEDYYRTSDFTPLHELFSMTISHSVRDYKPKAARLESPFASRVSADTKETGFVTYRRISSRAFLSMAESGSHEVNPNISGKDSTSSLTSTGSSDSDQDSTDVDADMSMSDTSSNTSHDVSDFEEDEAPFSKNFKIQDNRYGPDLHKYILNKHDSWSYERYVQIGELCHKQPEPSGQVRGIKAHKVIEVFPKSVFKFGSSYGVEPPPVNKQDQDVYHNYVNIGAHGPREPSKKEIQFYNRYLLRYQ